MPDLRRSLGLRDATALVVGTIVGTGVFLKTAPMTQAVGSPAAVLLAWLLAGVLSFGGALAYAELGALFPRAGGEYVYLREAWGRPVAFLYGWMRFWIGSPGSIAAYAVGTATFATGLVPLGGGARTAVAVGVVVVFTALNCLAVAVGGRVQSALTGLKILLIVALAAAVGLAGDAQVARLGQGGAIWRPGAFGAAMLAALWALDGWNNLPMAAGEVRDPERNVPRALVGGMAIVLGLYALVNVAYFVALPRELVATASSTAYPDAPPVATRAAATVLGDAATRAISAAFVLSALGAMNGSVLTGARVPYAMARDGLFPRALGVVSARTGAPVVSVVAVSSKNCALAAVGSFDELTDAVIFSSFVFYALATAGVFRLRRLRPDAPRAFRVPGYPWLPGLFIAAAAALVVDTIVAAPLRSGLGLGFIAAGLPVYALFRRRSA